LILEIVLIDRPSRSEVQNTQQYLLSLHSCAHVGRARAAEDKLFKTVYNKKNLA